MATGLPFIECNLCKYRRKGTKDDLKLFLRDSTCSIYVQYIFLDHIDYNEDKTI